MASAFGGKVVWITGAGSGIGAALARGFAAAGAKVVLSGRSGGDLTTTLAALPDSADGMILPFDVTEIDRHAALVEQVVARYGRIDILVNNAGVTQRSLVVDTSLDIYRRLMEVDFFAPVSLTKAVLPLMRAQKSGTIVVTSSVAGKFGTPLRSGYCAAKHAVMGFFDSLRAEVWADGIGVTVIVPGAVRTNSSVNALKGDGGKYGIMDKAIADGVPADEAAALILRGLAKGAPEIVVGNGMGVRLLVPKRRWSPRRFFRFMQSAKTT